MTWALEVLISLRAVGELRVLDQIWNWKPQMAGVQLERRRRKGCDGTHFNFGTLLHSGVVSRGHGAGGAQQGLSLQSCLGKLGSAEQIRSQEAGELGCAALLSQVPRLSYLAEWPWHLSCFPVSGNAWEGNQTVTMVIEPRTLKLI